MEEALSLEQRLLSLDRSHALNRTRRLKSRNVVACRGFLVKKTTIIASGGGRTMRDSLQSLMAKH